MSNRFDGTRVEVVSARLTEEATNELRRQATENNQKLGTYIAETLMLRLDGPSPNDSAGRGENRSDRTEVTIRIRGRISLDIPAEPFIDAETIDDEDRED